MRIHRVMLATVAGTVLLASPATAETSKPASGADSVAACLAKHPGRAMAACIGAESDACIGPNESSRTSAEVIGCLDHERAQWDELLNTAYRKLQKVLDDDQRSRLRDMQRAWMDSRDKSCGFFYDFFQGTMANPMIASCFNKETAQRAIFLMGFVADSERETK